MTEQVTACQVASRRETGVFLWALLLAVVLWLLLVAGVGAWLADRPAVPAAPMMIDARLVELPAAPAAPSPRIEQPAPVKHAELPKRRQPPKRQETPKPQPIPQQKPVAKPQQAPRPAHSKPLPDASPNAPGHEVMGARAVYSPLPRIPDDLRSQAMSEVAVARLQIHADGSVTVTLIQPTHNPKINQLILDTLRTWMFYPAISKGNPVESVQEIRIDVNVGD